MLYSYDTYLTEEWQHVVQLVLKLLLGHSGRRVAELLKHLAQVSQAEGGILGWLHHLPTTPGVTHNLTHQIHAATESHQ